MYRWGENTGSSKSMGEGECVAGNVEKSTKINVMSRELSMRHRQRRSRMLRSDIKLGCEGELLSLERE